MDEILCSAGIFQGVERSAVSALAGRLEPVSFPRGHTVYSRGQHADRLHIITSGKVKIGNYSTSGEEHLLAILGPSDIFGEMSVFDPDPPTSSATTVTEVHTLSMDHFTVRAWMADHPEQLLRLLARRLRRTDVNLADHIFTDVGGRVAKLLLQLAQRFGTHQDGGMRVMHDLTQDEIAQLVGTSRESVNKVLSQFARRGWIRLDAKTVWICDPARLAGRAK